MTVFLQNILFWASADKTMNTIMAEAAGLSRCKASGESLVLERCLDNQSKRSLRPSAPIFGSDRAVIMYGTCISIVNIFITINGKEIKYSNMLIWYHNHTILSSWTAPIHESKVFKVHSLMCFLLSPRHFNISDRMPWMKFNNN